MVTEKHRANNRFEQKTLCYDTVKSYASPCTILVSSCSTLASCQMAHEGEVRPNPARSAKGRTRREPVASS
ncbi:hypothetical protein CO2235_200134 [Cupriavidus oxalaticus]|uniref:Uncharacterized protein n=1 Tax=Cupriavidus oxalaticus TaxID=96344 RepID=A0A976BCM4_9BURK|nr:hypothetical protein CO2235_200134 [Cupriavidus oxalaticus]